jgi:hypothetical protein
MRINPPFSLLITKHQNPLESDETEYPILCDELAEFSSQLFVGVEIELGLE